MISGKAACSLWKPALYDEDEFDLSKTLSSRCHRGRDARGISRYGSVSVYDLASAYGEWTAMGSPIVGKKINDAWGSSGLSISADGAMVAAGDVMNDGGGNAEDDNRGHARVFSWSGTEWEQVGGDVEGEPGDRSGFSVSLHRGGSFAISSASSDGPQNIAWRMASDWTMREKVAAGSIEKIALAGDGDHLVAIVEDEFKVFELRSTITSPMRRWTSPATMRTRARRTG